MPSVRTVASDRALRGGLYERVSFGDLDAHSVDEQNEISRADCDGEGYEVVARYADKRISASRFTKKPRPDWEKMRQDVLAGRIDVLVVWEISRSDRKMGTYVALLDDLREHRVLLRVSGHRKTYEPWEPRDRRQLLEEGIDAEYESELTSQRVRRNTNSRAVKGLPHGRIPYGYIRTYDQASGRLLEQTPHPQQAPVVAEIVRRLAAGQSLNSIALNFDARGIPTPEDDRRTQLRQRLGQPAPSDEPRARWSVVTIRDIARSPTCIGIRTHNGVEIPGAWKAIAKPEHYYAALARISDPHGKRRRDGHAKYLLSYIAQCAHDEELFVPAGGGSCYSCKHGHNAIKREWLDELVVGGFLRKLAETGVQESILAGDDSEAQSAQQKISDLTTRLDVFRDKAADGTISIEALSRAEAKLIPQLDAARKTVAASARPTGPITELIGTGVEARTYKTLRLRWDRLTIEQQREIMRDFITIKITRAFGRSPSRTEVDRSRVKVTWNFGPNI